MDKAEKEMLKEATRQFVDITDEDFETYLKNPFNVSIAGYTPELVKYKIIAEVMESNYCTAGIKTGQKLVFRALPAVLLPEESDCPFCIRALAPIGNIFGKVWRKVFDGDGTPEPEIVTCLDPGLEKGGLGTVTFKVYAQKSE